ncbi:hypothetical protein ACFX2F_027430 [Malus domestica]
MVVGWEKEPLGSRVVADRALAVGPCAVGSKCKPDLWGTSAGGRAESGPNCGESMRIGGIWGGGGEFSLVLAFPF